MIILYLLISISLSLASPGASEKDLEKIKALIYSLGDGKSTLDRVPSDLQANLKDPDKSYNGKPIARMRIDAQDDRMNDRMSNSMNDRIIVRMDDRNNDRNDHKMIVRMNDRMEEGMYDRMDDDYDENGLRCGCKKISSASSECGCKKKKKKKKKSSCGCSRGRDGSLRCSCNQDDRMDDDDDGQEVDRLDDVDDDDSNGRSVARCGCSRDENGVERCGCSRIVNDVRTGAGPNSREGENIEDMLADLEDYIFVKKDKSKSKDSNRSDRKPRSSRNERKDRELYKSNRENERQDGKERLERVPDPKDVSSRDAPANRGNQKTKCDGDKCLDWFVDYLFEDSDELSKRQGSKNDADKYIPKLSSDYYYDYNYDRNTEPSSLKEKRSKNEKLKVARYILKNLKQIRTGPSTSERYHRNNDVWPHNPGYGSNSFYSQTGGHFHKLDSVPVTNKALADIQRIGKRYKINNQLDALVVNVNALRDYSIKGGKGRESSVREGKVSKNRNNLDPSKKAVPAELPTREKRLLPLTKQQKLLLKKRIQNRNKVARRNYGSSYGVPFELNVEGLGQINS